MYVSHIVVVKSDLKICKTYLILFCLYDIIYLQYIHTLDTSFRDLNDIFIKHKKNL